MKLRVLCVLVLCMTMLFSLSICACADQENGFNYYIENGEAVVYGYEGSKTSITVPETLGGYTVTRLDYSCFDGYSHLNSIELPNTLCKISANAFSGCTGLRSLEIPAGVTQISSYAFSGCTGLDSISLPDSLVALGSGAFDSCTSLSEIIIPANVEEIPANAFAYCYDLTEVTVMGRDTVVYEDLFSMMNGRGCTFCVWENSWIDTFWKGIYENYSGITVLHLMDAAMPEQITRVDVGNTDESAAEEEIPSYIPSEQVEEPTLYVTKDVSVKAVDDDGQAVAVDNMFVVYEVHKNTDDVVVYDLHIVDADGDAVSATFNPPQALVLPYPSGMDYETAQGMQFSVAHEMSSGTEYYSTMTGDLVRTPAGLMLYTSSFSPFTITWEENADPSGLPQTGDTSLPLGMLLAFAMLGSASVLALKRKRA